MMFNFIFYNLQYIIDASDIKDSELDYILFNPDCTNGDENLSDENLDEYLRFLDSIKWSTTDMNNEDILNPSYDDLQEYLKFLGQIKWPVYGHAVEIDQKDEIFQFEKYVEEFHDCITKYIKNNVFKSQLKTYITRLDTIRETIEHFSKFNLNKMEDFPTKIDDSLTNILNNLKLKYFNSSLNNETYNKFSYDFDKMIFNEIERKEDYKVLRSFIDKRIYLHLKEFMIIYKYIKIFPELLALGYAATKSSFKKVTIFFHMMALFLTQNEVNLNQYRNFVMFLIKKTFSNTPKFHLDYIYALNIYQSNTPDTSSLFFFSWEFNGRQRGIIKSRIINQYDGNRQYFFEEDRIHYDIVFRLYLFQHLIYLRYKNVEHSKFEEFKTFTKNIMNGEGCFKIQFYQFINNFC